jgi:hypothetical protein
LHLRGLVGFRINVRACHFNTSLILSRHGLRFPSKAHLKASDVNDLHSVAKNVISPADDSDTINRVAVSKSIQVVGAGETLPIT